MFPDKCLGFRFVSVDEFNKIVPSDFRFFYRPSSGFVCMCKEIFFMRFFKEFFRIFITLQNYPNAKLDKTEMLITSNEFKIRILSTEYHK